MQSLGCYWPGSSFDTAQERGEVAPHGGGVSKLREQNFASAADIGLTHKDIHEARRITDAEGAINLGGTAFITRSLWNQGQ